VLLLPFLVHSQINVPYDIHKKYPVAELLLKETSPYVRKEGFIEEATEFRLSRTFNFFLSVLYNSPANYQLELVTFNGKRLKSNVAAIGDKQVNALRLRK
jgi:hypothetical protein